MTKFNVGASPFARGSFKLKVGDRYGRWTVLEVPPVLPGESIWHKKPRCRCDCGNVYQVRVQSFVHGRSAGCITCSVTGRSIIHDDSYAGNGKYKRLYRIWLGMRKRCYNENEPTYARYGAKEVRVCTEWKDNYLAFRDWSLANGYNDNLSLDRYPDKAGNYEPDNCRWATLIQQARNTTTNRPLVAFGESKLMVEWSEDHRCVVNLNTLNTRIQRGWSDEWAIVAPVRSPRG